MPDNSFEKQVQELMRGLELTPDETVWTNLQKELQPEKRRRRFAFWWWLPLGLLLLGGAWMLYQHQYNNPTGITQPTPQKNTGTPAATGKTGTDSPTTHTPATGWLQHNTVVPPASQTPALTRTTGAAAFVQAGAKANEQKNVTPAFPAAGGAMTGDDLQTGSFTRTVFLRFTAGYGIEPAARFTIQALSPAGSPAVGSPLRLPENNARVTASAEDKLPTADTAHTVMPVVTSKKSHRWQLAPFAQAGMSKAGKGISINRASSVSDYYSNPGSGTGSASYSRVYTTQTAKAGLSLKAGLLAEKTLGKKWRFQAGLYYAFSSFTQNSRTLKDSVNTSANFSSIGGLVQSSNEIYHLHAVGLQLGWHYQLLKQVGLSAGLLNDISIAAEKKTITQNSVSQLNPPPVVTAIRSQAHRYVPAVYFSLDMPVKLEKKHEWWFSPYIQYGAGRSFKSSANMQRNFMWQYGLGISRHIR